MYHRKKGRKLGRRPDHRKAMMRNLAISLIHEERIETTVTRAKELRRFADRLVTYAKRQDLPGRRLVQRKLGNQPDPARKLIEEISVRYEDRPGGYTRVLKTGFRRGDSAPTAVIEWVEEQLPKRRRRQRPATSAKAAPQETPAEESGEAQADDEAVAGEDAQAKATEPTETDGEQDASTAGDEAAAAPTEPDGPKDETADGADKDK